MFDWDGGMIHGLVVVDWAWEGVGRSRAGIEVGWRRGGVNQRATWQC